ncbi:MAG: DUF3426 domain-containing protein [Gammaproteobacteria bacterium]
MHAECPHCKSVFRVAPRQLAAAKGMVRCGQCKGVFNAAKSLKPQQPPSIYREASTAKFSAAEAIQVYHERQHQPVAEVVLEETAQPQTTNKRFIAPDTVVPINEPTLMNGVRSAAQQLNLDVSRQEPEVGQPGPVTAQEVPSVLLEDLQARAASRRYSRARTSALGAGVAALVLLLTVQGIYHNRAGLAQYPQFYNPLVRICATLGCDIAPRIDSSKIELVSRNIYSHPNQDSALMVVATLINHADFPQPYPVVQISLTNVQGRVIASRRFRPEEYVAGTLVQDIPLMKPESPVSMQLELVDPGSNAMAFEFDFL